MRRTLLVGIAILLLTAGCTGSDEPDEPARATSPTAMSDLIDYGDDGIVIADAKDAERLVGAPEDFTAFIVEELARQEATKDDVCPEAPELRVERIDVRGWAAGGVTIPRCGGNGALWARTPDGWKTVWSDQTLPDCTILQQYDFPPRIAGTECGTPDGKTRAYP